MCMYFSFFPERSEVRRDTEIILNCSENVLLYAI